MRATFPSDFKTLKEKQSKEYILEYAKAMFDDYGAWDTYDLKRSKYRKLRLWAEGMQSIEHLKPIMDNKSGYEFNNINFMPVAEGKEFVNNMVNHLCNSDYEIKIRAIDARSKTKKDDFIAKEKAKIFLRDAMSMLEDELKVPLQDQNPQFKTDKELERYIELNYKQSTELATEMLVSYITAECDYEDYLKRKIYKDLVVCKHACLRVFNERDGQTKIRYVDPENLVMPPSNDDRFKDINYIGEIRYMRLGDIIRMAGGEFSSEDYRDIASMFEGKKYGNPDWIKAWNTSHLETDCYSLPYYDFVIPVLDFEFLSNTYSKYEAKNNKFGNRKVHEKKLTYKQTEYAKQDAKLYEDNTEYRFEGKWIVGTDFLFNYGLGDNIVRENVGGKYDDKASLTYINIMPDAYMGKNVSKMEVMIPFLEQMQLAFVKMQQIIATHRPNSYAIDVFGLQGIMLGKGGEESSATDLIEFYKSEGILMYTSRPEMGNPTQTPPITPIPDTALQAIQAQIQIYEYNRQRVQAVTGWNEAMNGTKIDKDALVGTQKIQVNNAQNSVKDIFYAFKDLTKRTITQVVLSVQHALRFSDVAKVYDEIIGTDSVKILEVGKDVAICRFGIFVDYLPTQEERQDVLEALQLALQTQSIKPSDYVKIKDTKNSRLAYIYLSEAESKYAEEKQQMAMQNSQASAQANNETVMLKVQAEEKQTMTKLQAEVELLQIKSELEEQSKARDFEREKALLQMKLDYQRTIADERNKTSLEVAKVYDDNFNIASNKLPNNGLE